MTNSLFQDFEAGKFTKNIKRRRKLKEAVRRRLTQKELYAIVNAPATSAPSHAPRDAMPSSSSSSENELNDNDEDDQVMIPPIQFDEDENAVDFTYLLKKREENFAKMAAERQAKKKVQKVSEDIEGMTLSTDQVASVSTHDDVFHQGNEDGKELKKDISLDDEAFGNPKLVPQESVDDIKDFSDTIDQTIQASRQGSWANSTSLELSTEDEPIEDLSQKRNRLKSMQRIASIHEGNIQMY